MIQLHLCFKTDTGATLHGVHQWNTTNPYLNTAASTMFAPVVNHAPFLSTVDHLQNATNETCNFWELCMQL